jgi:hypothetical protein
MSKTILPFSCHFLRFRGQILRRMTLRATSVDGGLAGASITLFRLFRAVAFIFKAKKLDPRPRVIVPWTGLWYKHRKCGR